MEPQIESDGHAALGEPPRAAAEIDCGDPATILDDGGLSADRRVPFARRSGPDLRSAVPGAQIAPPVSRPEAE